MTDPNYRIAAARRSHLAAIPVIERAAARLFSERDLPPHIRYRVTDRNTLLKAQRDGRLWVALAARGGVVGFALADTMDNDAFLDEVDVTPDHGRRGIGKRLVAAVIEWAEAQGRTSLTLVTFRHVPWNAPFYASLGFRTLGEDELSPGVRERLQQEQAAGIDPGKRVAMRLALAPGGRRS